MACRTLFDAVLDVARQTPQAVIAVEAGVSLSYGEAVQRAADLGDRLSRQGAGPGSVVAFAGAPGLAFLVHLLAAFRSGFVWLGVNPRYTPAEVEHLFHTARPAVLSVAENGGVAAATQAAAAQGIATDVVAASAAPRDPAQLAGAAEPPTVACLVFTSGTTGRPKAAQLTHAGILHAARLYVDRYGGGRWVSLCNLPINHVGCVVDIVASTLAGGGTLVFQPEFRPEAVGPLIAQHGITAIGQVPAMWRMIAAQASFWEADLSSLRHLVWSGAPMGRSLIESLSRIGCELSTCYGMTEATGSVTFTSPGASVARLEQTIGAPAEPGTLRIVAADQPVHAPGSVGEIQLRTPMRFLGYLGDPSATDAAFTSDGWYRTGDLGQWTAEGHVRLTGRSTEMFKSGGYNVYPREVEAVLESHPQVAQACVVPRRDPLWDEVGHAVIVLHDTQDMVAIPDLDRHCRQSLAAFKVPKAYAIVQSLPMLPNGKLDRMAIKADLARAAEDA